MKGEITSLLVDGASIFILVTKGDEILKWARMPLKEGQISNGVIVDIDGVASRVSELFNDLHLNNTKVFAALSGVHSQSKIISLPPMPENMVGKYIKAKLEKELSVSLDTLRCSWQIIESTETEMKVFSVVYPRNIFNSILDMLYQAGVSTVSLELAPLALARGAGRDTAVVADVRSSEVDIVILDNKLPVIVNSLLLPRDRSLYDNITVIRDEINRNISLYAAENTSKNELPVVLSGDVVTEQDIYANLSQELAYSIVPFSPLMKCPDSIPVSRYAAVMGLALREPPVEMKLSSIIRLNLLSENRQPETSSWTRIRNWPSKLASGISAMFTKPVTTIHVEDSGLRLLVTEGSKIIKWGEIDLEPGLVSDGVVEDPAAVAQKVSELFAMYDVEKGKVVVGVSGLHSLHRTTTFPRLSKSELTEAITRDSERELPVPLNDLYLSWQVIGTSKEETIVFSVAYPKKLADGLVDVLYKAGLEPEIMDLAPMAVARATGSITSAAVDVRDVEVDITVLTQGAPEVIRTIRFPEVRTAADRLSLVKEELKRTLDFYKSKNPTRSPLPVFLSGEIDLDSDIYLSWSKELYCPVLPPSPPIFYPDDMPVNSYMTNIGLSMKKTAVREDHITLVNLNTLPDIYMPRQIPWAKTIAPVAGFIGLALLIYGGYLVWNKTADINLLSTQIADTRVEVALGQANQRFQEQQITELEERISEASGSREVVADAYDMIVSLQEKLRGDVELAVYSVHNPLVFTSLSHSGEILVLSGEAMTEQQVFEYARTLEMSGRFSEIVFSIRQNDQQGVNFTLTFECRD